MLKKFFWFKKGHFKDLPGNLDDFNKFIQDLGSCNKKFEDEDVAVILLNSLPYSFEGLTNAIEYGRDFLT